jgi:membrane-associated phospholipid phosphatase
MSRREPFWHWPGWGQLGYAVLLALGVFLWFIAIFHGTNYLTDLRSYRVRVHLDFECAMPFVPQAVVVYLSMNLLYVLAPFALPTRRQLNALAATVAAVTLVGGLCFLVFPARAAFPPPGEMRAWTGPVRFAKEIALRNNLVPSLHVGLAVVCVTVYAERARWLGKVLLWTWAVAIAASTLLLHQHYLLDVITGFLLGWAGVRLVYDRWTRAAP